MAKSVISKKGGRENKRRKQQSKGGVEVFVRTVNKISGVVRTKKFNAPQSRAAESGTITKGPKGQSNTLGGDRKRGGQIRPSNIKNIDTFGTDVGGETITTRWKKKKLETNFGHGWSRGGLSEKGSDIPGRRQALSKFARLSTAPRKQRNKECKESCWFRGARNHLQIKKWYASS